MVKLRKMLGDIQSKTCIALMRLIETQSAKTLAVWSIGYAKEHYLPIYEQECPRQTRLREVIVACEGHLSVDEKISAIQPILKEAAQIGRDTAHHAVAQAAARAIATACAAISTPTSALGFLFYGAAATAYHKAGLAETPAVYDTLAAEELAHALQSLRQAAVPQELHSVKINWNC